MNPSYVKQSTKLIIRLCALLNALRDGPLPRPTLFACVHDAYPPSKSIRRMVDRDIEYLRALGIKIERSADRPPVYTLFGGTPVFDEESLRILALIRDTFGVNHPQFAQIFELLGALTCDMSPEKEAFYMRRQALRAPVQPAIDYSPYATLIARLESAISKRQMIRFMYQSTRAESPTLHPRIEPHEIEYHERHFYLVAYSHLGYQVNDFRIDRIQDDEHFAVLERLPPDMVHSRVLVRFRYRLAAVLVRGEISQRFDEQRVVEWLPNGDVIIEALGRSDFFIRRTLLKYAGLAELLEPVWLREQMMEDVAALSRLYRK
jgi:predicted DNA-binding transcriptional regulator YafY